MRRFLLTLALLPAMLAVLLGLAPAALAAPTEIRVGTEGTYPPFSYHEGSKLTGYDVEVMQAVAKQAGWTPSSSKPPGIPSFPRSTPTASTPSPTR